MWLQDFLPQDVPNIRIMTYGYDSELSNTADNSGMLDYRKALAQQLEVARNSSEVSWYIYYSPGAVLTRTRQDIDLSSSSAIHLVGYLYCR